MPKTWRPIPSTQSVGPTRCRCHGCGYRTRFGGECCARGCRLCGLGAAFCGVPRTKASAGVGYGGGGAVPDRPRGRLQVASATQNQALSALLFLYREMLNIDLPWLNGIVRSKRPVRLPVVHSESVPGQAHSPKFLHHLSLPSDTPSGHAIAS